MGRLCWTRPDMNLHESRARERRPAVTLFRSSRDRQCQAREYYEITVAFARAGLTHVVDLLEGLEPGGRVELRPVDPSWPQIVQDLYPVLLRALPHPWLRALREARELRAADPACSWREVVRRARRPRCVWMVGPGGLIAQVEPNGTVSGGWHVADPVGRLRLVLSGPMQVDVWAQAARQVVVWKQEVLPRSEAEENARAARERQEAEERRSLPVYVMAGATEDRFVLRYDLSEGRPGSRAATDLSRFVWQHGPTDRIRPGVGMHVADTHSLYDLRISRLFTPLRTFQLDAVPSPDRTTWIDLLAGDAASGQVARSELSKRRGRVFGAQHLTGHDRVAKDLGYSVLADAWPVGNGRCRKRGVATHTICDVCFRLYGERVQETTRHIVLECRQARLLLDVIWRARLEAVSQDFNEIRDARRCSQDELLRVAACTLVTACVPPAMESSEPLMTLVRAVQCELHRARCVNAAMSRVGVVQFDIGGMYRVARAKLLSEGLSRQRAAVEWESELRLRHPGWEPGEDGPVKKWEREWLASGYLREGSGGRLECGLAADPLSVPGAALVAASVGVRATLQLSSRRDVGVHVGLALRALAVADLHPPRVGVRVSAYSGGVALALDVRISLAEEERRRRLVASVGEEEKPECVIYTDGGYESGQGGGQECAGCGGGWRWRAGMAVEMGGRWRWPARVGLWIWIPCRWATWVLSSSATIRLRGRDWRRRCFGSPSLRCLVVP